MIPPLTLYIFTKRHRWFCCTINKGEWRLEVFTGWSHSPEPPHSHTVNLLPIFKIPTTLPPSCLRASRTNFFHVFFFLHKTIKTKVLSTYFSLIRMNPETPHTLPHHTPQHSLPLTLWITPSHQDSTSSSFSATKPPRDSLVSKSRYWKTYGS